MATWHDVIAAASDLPQVEHSIDKHDRHCWDVTGSKGGSLAWERPLSKADIKKMGASAPPDGDVLAFRLGDLFYRDAVLEEHGYPLFVSPHFAGYPAVLAVLADLDVELLEDLLDDAWRACAPPGLLASEG